MAECVNKGFFTPKKVYYFGDVCTLCGYQFYVNVKLPAGDVVKKCTDRKLRLTAEKSQKITAVLPSFTHVEGKGVCRKCFNLVEKALKMEHELRTTKDLLRSNYEEVLEKNAFSVPSPSFRRVKVEKRLSLESPIGNPPKKAPFTVTVKKMVKILPMKEFQENSMQAESIVPKKGVRRKLSFCTSDTCTGVENGLLGKIEFPAYLFQTVKSTELQSDILTQVAIHHPSGTKYKVLECKTDEQIVKAIVRDEPNKFNSISERLMDWCPNSVIKCVCERVAEEAKHVSKSYTSLHDVSYSGIMGLSWDQLQSELKQNSPNLLAIFSAIAQDSKKGPLPKRRLLYVLTAAALCLRGRNREMSALSYQVGFILKHGGCTVRDIERLSKLGLSMSPASLDLKLKSWSKHLDGEVIKLRQAWIDNRDSSVRQTYQLAGDNWDRNILPTYRTAKDKTLSLHLFQVVALKDRILQPVLGAQTDVGTVRRDDTEIFIPSIAEQEKMKTEMTFLVATALVNNIPCLQKNFSSIYPNHLPHKYSDVCGVKTEQFPLGLYDCDEHKTKEVIKLLKELSATYVPIVDGEILDQVFFGGDRLTDEQVQVAQQALSNGDTPSERLEGFISKIEDFHRLMNFMEAIYKLTYSTKSAGDRGTVYYYRNVLDKRNVKGDVKNSYRAYKMLYYVMFEAISCCLFLQMTGADNWDEETMLPLEFDELTKEEKISWINEKAELIVTRYAFEDKQDMFENMREILLDQDHEENYWMASSSGEFKCHFCSRAYTHLASAKAHEKCVHGHVPKSSDYKGDEPKDELLSYLLLLYKLTCLHKNLDSAVDMGDGERVVRSAKYEMPLYNRTGKVKYLIGSIQITSLIEEHLTPEQVNRFIWNRFVNISGGKNRNISIDEYVEILNRDTKITCRGFQTKESIIDHSKEFPLVTDTVKHFDDISSVKGRKGFHKIPSFQEDVRKVTMDLISNRSLTETDNRKLSCRTLCTDSDAFQAGVKGLPIMISRHRASMPVRRLRDKTYS